MSFSSNGTEGDLINLRELAEQQKEQRALKISYKIFKQTHDVKLAERLSPITKKLDTINKSTKQLGEIVEKLDVEDGNTQTPSIENTPITRSLRETLAFVKTSKHFLNK